MYNFLKVMATVLFAISVVTAQRTWNGSGNLLTSLVDNEVITVAAGARGTLNVPPGMTVKIVGGTAETAIANNNAAISLNIGANSKVIWEAFLKRNAGSSTINVVNITGRGTFEMIGGLISNVSNATMSAAINNESTGAVNIFGGTVSATMGRAINNESGGIVNISGGTISER
jgi:hypothetical protein